MAAVSGVGLVAVSSAVQLSLIEPVWTAQQWILAVVLPLTALVVMVAGGLALWDRLTGPPAAPGRYRARHAWQARRRTAVIWRPLRDRG
jgi:hypothetical protein